MRLIDADVLKRDIDLAPDEWAKGRTIYGIINEQPAIDAEPVRHGYWIGLEYDGYADGFPVYDLWECSECRYEHKGEDTPNYCSNCGAKMDKEWDN